MIILNSYTKKLEIVSNVANLEWSSSWVDVTDDCQIPGITSTTYNEDQGLTINGTITAVSAPTKNTNTKTYIKQIEYISCYNSTGVSANITVQININGTARILFKVTLSNGDNMTYNEDSGWQVIDSLGRIKIIESTITLSFSINEIPTGLINGSNTNFVLANTPNAGTEEVYYQGQLQRPALDYTISGATITFVTAPESGTSIYVSYIY